MLLTPPTTLSTAPLTGSVASPVLPPPGSWTLGTFGVRIEGVEELAEPPPEPPEPASVPVLVPEPPTVPVEPPPPPLAPPPPADPPPELEPGVVELLASAMTASFRFLVGLAAAEAGASLGSADHGGEAACDAGKPRSEADRGSHGHWNGQESRSCNSAPNDSSAP